MVAGDVFDRWNTPVEFVNFVIDRIPQTTILAIPGQHDLPHHRYDDIERSAYWTLVAAGKINTLEPGAPWHLGRMSIWGFPWGSEPQLPPIRTEKPDDWIWLAVAHRYLWKDGHTYPDAPQECSVENTGPLLWSANGYDAAVFGDNHSAFLTDWSPTECPLCNGSGMPAGTSERSCPCSKPVHILNHGAFIRRRTDERHLIPAAGILWSDGTITTVPLDTFGDKWAAVPVPDAMERAGADVAELTRLLETAADAPVSFRETALRYLETHNPPPAVAAMVRTWLEVGT